VIQSFEANRRRAERMRTALVLSLTFWAGLASARAQPYTNEDIQKGHQLAATICAVCHVAAPDQAYAPIMKPPAPSFESIAQRKDTTPDSLRLFMTTTHRGLDVPAGMPDPMLMDYQIKEITAYILSLRR
jgi:mono/diheme cytochrome c family protein